MDHSQQTDYAVIRFEMDFFYTTDRSSAYDLCMGDNWQGEDCCNSLRRHIYLIIRDWVLIKLIRRGSVPLQFFLQVHAVVQKALSSHVRAEVQPRNETNNALDGGDGPQMKR